MLSIVNYGMVQDYREATKTGVVGVEVSRGVDKEEVATETITDREGGCT